MPAKPKVIENTESAVEATDEPYDFYTKYAAEIFNTAAEAVTLQQRSKAKELVWSYALVLKQPMNRDQNTHNLMRVDFYALRGW